jgi:MurNAc alpha-1-phosphate uridylyltransferase
MKAMILAAGLGERMRPLTDHTPKPLLRVGGVPLIEHHIRRLAAAGFRELVINVSHLAEQIIDYCGDGSRWGLSIDYSPEEEPLETAGGIHRALPLLGTGPFLVVNGDIWIEFDFGRLRGHALAPGDLAHLVMVGNPPQHPQGDFLLDAGGRVCHLPTGATGVTYSGVGVYGSELFAAMKPGKLRLRPLLDEAISAGRLGGEFFPGRWEDVGTPQRLAALDERVSAGAGLDDR